MEPRNLEPETFPHRAGSILQSFAEGVEKIEVHSLQQRVVLPLEGFLLMNSELSAWRNRVRESAEYLIMEDEADDDDDEEDENASVQAALEVIEVGSNLQAAFCHGGSRPGKRRNIDRQDQEGAVRIYKDYFSEEPTYSDELFQRRYRIPRVVFLRVHNALLAYDRYFQQRRDATGLMGKSPFQKNTAAIRMLAYGASADSLDEYCRVSEAVAMESMKRFCEGVECLFAHHYLRCPTRADVEEIMDEMGALGFPGCLGSIDCQHWQWKNRRAAYHGQYVGKFLRTVFHLSSIFHISHG